MRRRSGREIRRKERGETDGGEVRRQIDRGEEGERSGGAEGEMEIGKERNR